jgi:hypothetical protein
LPADALGELEEQFSNPRAVDLPIHEFVRDVSEEQLIDAIATTWVAELEAIVSGFSRYGIA